jgi:hypothetical protein
MAASRSPNHVSNEYPLGLEPGWTYKSGQSLKFYRECLVRDEDELFVPEGKPRFVMLWDMPDGEHNFRPESRIDKLEQFDATLAIKTLADPSCRFA